MAKPIVPEDDVKKDIHKWYKARNAWSYAPVQNGMGVTGIPDRIGCIPITITPDMVGKTVGLFVAVEAKASNKFTNVSANQREQLDGIHEAYGVGIVVADAEEHLPNTLEELLCRITNPLLPKPRK